MGGQRKLRLGSRRLTRNLRNPRRTEPSRHILTLAPGLRKFFRTLNAARPPLMLGPRLCILLHLLLENSHGCPPTGALLEERSGRSLASPRVVCGPRLSPWAA